MRKAALYFSQPSPLQLGSRHTDGGHRWRDGTLGPLRDIVEAGDQLVGKERTLDGFMMRTGHQMVAFTMDISWLQKKPEGTDAVSEFDVFQPWLAPPSGSIFL